MGAFYGLRRSEVVGLKWNAIDFEKKTITIKHTVTEVTIDGKLVMVEKDRAKTKSSLRTLPLVEPFEKVLLAMKQEQAVNRSVCGNMYGTAVSAFLLIAFAAGDPIQVVNNLSDFIFGLIRAVGMILLGFGIVQIGLSLKSHDPSQRANGFLTLAGGVVITFAKEILTLITG